MRIVPLITMLLIASFNLSTAYASKIYQWKDANGNTVFGDKPSKKIEIQEVEILPLMTMPAYETPEQKEEREKKEKKLEQSKQTLGVKNKEDTEEKTFNYTAFKVASPTEGDYIRSNTGNVLINFDLTPSLNETDTVTIYVDGKKQVKESKSLSAHLSNLNRGEHSVFAVIKDKEGAIVFNSNTIRFHVMRHSKLFNKNKRFEEYTTF